MSVGIDASIPKYPRRFRAKVVLSVLLVTVLFAVAGSGLYFLRHRRFVEADWQQRGRTLVTSLADNSRLGLFSGNVAFLNAPIAALMAREDVLFVSVYDSTGTEIVRRMKPHAARPEKMVLRDLRRFVDGTAGQRAGRDQMEFILAVRPGEQDGEAASFGGGQATKARPKKGGRILGWVRIGLSKRPLKKSLSEALMGSLYLSGGLLIFGIFMALLVGWRLSSPIRRLTEGVDELRRGNLSFRVDVQSHDELGQLADSFNRMAWNLKDTMSRLEGLNHHLEDEVAERTDEIRRISDFVKVLNGPTRIGPLVEACMGAFQLLAQALAVAVYGREGDALVLVGASGAPREAFGSERTKVGERNVGKAAAAAEPLVVDRIPENARLCVAIGQALASLVYLPIRFGSDLQGVVVCAFAQPVEQATMGLMGQAVDQLAIAMANARAFEAAERLAKELETRNEALVRQRDLLQQQKQKLEEANRLKSEFLANTTHELRTPLNAILGYTELVLEEVYGPITPDQNEALVGIHESGHHLLGLINQTLDYAKLEAGQMPAVVTEVDLNRLCKEAVVASGGLTKDRPYRITVSDSGTAVHILSDEAKVRQIILNLLSNAVKFTEKGSVVVGLRSDGQGGAAITVKDTGIGIAPKNLDVIFDAFRQLDGSSTRAAGGTGLGLAISRRLAVLLGGRLAVESRPGHGSTFTLYLPPRPPQQSVTPARAESMDDVSATMGVDLQGEDAAIEDIGLDVAPLGTIAESQGPAGDNGAIPWSGGASTPGGAPTAVGVSGKGIPSGTGGSFESAPSSDLSGLELLDLSQGSVPEGNSRMEQQSQGRNGASVVPGEAESDETLSTDRDDEGSGLELDLDAVFKKFPGS